MPSNTDMQQRRRQKQEQQLLVSRKLMEMTYLGDPGYCFLTASGFAFTLWYRLMLRETGRDSLWVPKGLVFKIDCTIAEENVTYKHVYNRWFLFWLVRDERHRTAFANAYCDEENRYKPVVVAAINCARRAMQETFDRSKARQVLETELSRENAAPEELFDNSSINTRALWEEAVTRRPERICSNLQTSKRPIWDGLRPWYSEPPQYVRRREDAQHQ